MLYICSHNNAYTANDPHFVSKIVNKFYDESSSWPEKLEASALGLFRLLFILEVAMLGITGTLPSLASGIVQGAHVSSGNALISTATQVGVTGYLAAKTGLTSAISGGATVRNIRTASQMAREQEGNTVINTARNYMTAHRAVKADALGRSYPANINFKLQAALDKPSI